MLDEVEKRLLHLVNKSDEPLSTRELVLKMKMTRSKVFYRLFLLRAENRIRGKFIGSGKGSWIWWKKRGGLR
jgi:hypothetical protein